MTLNQRALPALWMTIFGQKKCLKLVPLHWECEVLAAGPPENSQFASVYCFLLTRYTCRSFMEQTGVTVLTEGISELTVASL